MKPLSNQVLIKPTEKEEKVGSFLLAASAQEEQNIGVIVDVGPGKLSKEGVLLTMNVTQGETVLYLPDRAVSCTLNGEKHILVAEDDILAVM